MRNISLIVAATVSLTAAPALAEGWGVPSLPKQGSMTPVDTKIKQPHLK